MEDEYGKGPVQQPGPVMALTLAGVTDHGVSLVDQDQLFGSLIQRLALYGQVSLMILFVAAHNVDGIVPLRSLPLLSTPQLLS